MDHPRRKVMLLNSDGLGASQRNDSRAPTRGADDAWVLADHAEVLLIEPVAGSIPGACLLIASTLHGDLVEDTWHATFADAVACANEWFDAGSREWADVPDDVPANVRDVNAYVREHIRDGKLVVNGEGAASA